MFSAVYTSTAAICARQVWLSCTGSTWTLAGTASALQDRANAVRGVFAWAWGADAMVPTRH